MGAGSFPAGVGPAGADPVQGASPAVRYDATKRQAALFDLGTRSFPRNADGTVQTVHWVDQAVALALGVNQGSISGASTIGNRLRSIKRSAGPRLVGEVTDAVHVALAALLDRGDISVTDLQIATPVRGQIVVAVSYVNRRLTPNLPRDIRLVF